MGGFSVNRSVINPGSDSFPEQGTSVPRRADSRGEQAPSRPRGALLEGLTPLKSSREGKQTPVKLGHDGKDELHGGHAGPSSAGDAYSPNNRMVPRVRPGPKNADILQTMGYHSLLMKAYKSGQAPAQLYDGAFLRDLVMVENARHPGLDLVVCSVGANPALRDWGVHDAMTKALLRPGEPHSCVLTDDNTHAAAMSLQVLGEPHAMTLSIVVLDSVKPRDSSEEVTLHKALRSEIKKSLDDVAFKNLRIQVTIVPMGVQVSNEGCNIFALVAAKKAAKGQSMKDLHEWGHEMLGRAAPGIHTLPLALEPEMLLEPAFFKHAMKRDLIQNVLDADDNLGPSSSAPVNNKGDTLLQRFEKFDRPVVVTTRTGEISTQYSRSYEEKRLDKFARLIEYKLAQLTGKPLPKD